MRRYSFIFFSVLIGLLIALSTFNLVVDPYDASGWVSLDGVNARKSRAHEDGRRVLVSHQLLKRSEQSIIIGSSRVVDGYKESYDDGEWRGGLYNAGLRGSNAYELAHLAGLAAQKDDLRCVLIGLDVSEFSGGEKFKSAFLISRFTDGSHWKSLGRMMLSPNTFMRSVQTIEDNITGGSDKPPFKDRYEAGEQRRRFINSAINTYRSHQSLEMSEERIDYLFKSLEILAAKGVQITSFIHPVHAWYEEPSMRAGVESDYLKLRRLLLERMEHLSTTYSPAAPCTAGAHTLWDFSGFQTLTTTPIPRDTQEMSHDLFHEPAHYLNFTGRHILDKLGGMQTLQPIGGFGVVLQSETLDQVVTDAKTRRETYQSSKDGILLNSLLEDLDRTDALSDIQSLTKSDWKQLEKLLEQAN